MNDVAQKLLFDEPPKARQIGPVDNRTCPPLAHSKDPRSSFEAGDRALSTGRLQKQMKRVYSALLNNPGVTSAELAKIMDCSRYDTARRLPTLESKGLVVRGSERTCRVCKSRCLTWRVKK